VQHRTDVVVEFAVGETGEELVLVEEVVDLAVDEIGELVGARQVIDRDDVREPALIERLDEIGADDRQPR
jgi:hypothetical protein